jgi:glycine/D-amino acid oxidase-like deaminating enzyme
MHSDAIVVGAGIIGSACARALAGAGLSVTVLEASAAASGTSGSGEGNLLVSDKLAGPELALAQYSLELWARLADAMTDELGPGFPALEFERKGGLVVATSDVGAEPLLRFAAQQRKAGLDARPLDRAAALELEPDLTPAVTAAVLYPEDAQVQPVVANEALLASARARGAHVVLGTRVTGLTRRADGAVSGVLTQNGSLEAGIVVLAAGPWSAELATSFGACMPVQPRRGFVLVTTRMARRIRHKVYDADYVGAVESDAAELQTSSVVESTASGTVLVGSSRRRVGFDPRLDLRAIHDIARKAVHLFPFLSSAAVMRVYGGFRPSMPDHLPAIGPDPKIPGLWHATGHEGAGIGLSLGTAAIIAALIGGTESPVDARPFSPSRDALTARRPEP